MESLVLLKAARESLGFFKAWPIHHMKVEVWHRRIS
jgi:hypothetical protein